jgi:hypothetical protein
MVTTPNLSKKMKFAIDLLSNGITNGFAILLPLELARRIPGILLSPMNIA